LIRCLDVRRTLIVRIVIDRLRSWLLKLRLLDWGGLGRRGRPWRDTRRHHNDAIEHRQIRDERLTRRGHITAD
jgi:hypothetical protein